MIEDRLFDCFVGLKLSREVNKQLNQFCGRSGFGRSKIVRLALLDFLGFTQGNRRQIEKIIKIKATSGYGNFLLEAIP
jgi:hypothetical protein